MPVEEHDPFEDRFTDALRHAGHAFETGGLDLAARGEAQGRRSASRRRAATVGGVSAVALAGTLVLPLVHDDGGRQRAVTTGASFPAASPTAQTPVTRDELLSTLKRLLPEGQFSQEEARGTDEDRPPYARVVYDDGKGEAAVTVALDRLPPGGRTAAGVTECPDRTFFTYDTCTGDTLADGSALTVVKGYGYPNRRSDVKVWTATLVTPTGQHITVAERNSATEAGGPASRDLPPLSLAQLKTLITAGEWRTVVDAMPPDARRPTTEPEHRGSDSAVSSTLGSLLPEGVQVVSKSGGDPTFGYVVLDDGKGASYVQVNVQDDMRDVEDQLFGADARTLPDGTKVAWHQGPGEKGGAGVVMWTVDTIRTDGFRVAISAFNSGAQGAPATRTAPALTMEQMEAIATSEKWRARG
ncbi:hypothetical protein [Streptomyces sp. SID2888]|uniref:hypothetical protein n=1 Tax=Streptomyces TaxID=1883 RepID=UPI00136EF910|nr:hypothetical protein [Streptomyces sp. SID2888]MYV44491.1 hypothetical protein [Streptomyces sp. SID2888]